MRGTAGPLAVALLFHPCASFAQFPEPIICNFEKSATAGLDDKGKMVTSGESSTGEIVISNLNSNTPIGSGNIGAVKLSVLRKSKDTIWLAEMTADEVASVITLFFKTGIVM